MLDGIPTVAWKKQTIPPEVRLDVHKSQARLLDIKTPNLAPPPTSPPDALRNE